MLKTLSLVALGFMLAGGALADDITPLSSAPLSSSELADTNDQAATLIAAAKAVLRKEYGEFTDDSLKLAVGLYQQAVALNSAEAALDLANLYFDTARWADSIPLYRPLAETGNAHAEAGLGGALWETQHFKQFMDEQGKVEESAAVRQAIQAGEVEALDWINKSVEAGDTLGMYWLAVSLLEGGIDGAGQDAAASDQWLQRAAKAGSPDASGMLGERLYKSGQYKAAVPYLTAGIMVNPDAALDLGTMYYQGLGVTKDKPKAFEALMQARKAWAAYMLAQLYDREPGYIDPGKAADMFMLAFNTQGGDSEEAELANHLKKYSVATRKAIQQAMAAQGDYDGPIDGNFNKASIDAFYNNQPL